MKNTAAFKERVFMTGWCDQRVQLVERGNAQSPFCLLPFVLTGPPLGSPSSLPSFLPLTDCETLSRFLTSLCRKLLIYKMENIIVPTS